MLSSTVPADRTDPRPLHLRLAVDADPAVLAELVDHYRGYATALARRLHRRGLPLEDLEQVALEALVKALQRFDPDRGVPFLAYATPTVVGAIKRHYRDSGWMVRVPRGVHELVRAARTTADELTGALGRPPSAEEVASALQIDVETLLSMEEALIARSVTSLDASPTGGTPAAERVAEDDRRLASAENRVALGQALRLLASRDAEVLDLYFAREWSQVRIADHFGVSQMQVSRWIASALKRLRTVL